ncbi:GyrI-like domain-containing protein [Psychroserpens jangbogonensis]|uniref:GyrI-like domain-containing protein n=1 Tax=Psychroserpens jangbogonensis TaxID=1484460 RepID=UPI00053E442F|nr:GyrI-like domain-containing protein [Psychroserpens jangbogonensis]
MGHRIEVIEDRYVVGVTTKTSVLTINEKTRELAKSFMPRRHEITSRIGKHVFSIQDYGKDYLPTNPNSEFDKWVAIEVKELNNVPEGMESFIIKSGIYVVFSFKGSVLEFPRQRAFIFQEWLPNSDYQLDKKAHFEILSEDYSKDLQNIEEDIWIPVKKK